MNTNLVSHDELEAQDFAGRALKRGDVIYVHTSVPIRCVVSKVEAIDTPQGPAMQVTYQGQGTATVTPNVPANEISRTVEANDALGAEQAQSKVITPPAGWRPS